MSLLGGLAAETFYGEIWQRRGAVFRGSAVGFEPVPKDTLWRLASNEAAETRLVFEHGEACPWQVTHGPFPSDAQAALPESGWSLLVQEVDSHLPHVAAILEHVSFVPRWLLDDVMVSIAPAGGSVGPHIDQYDAFLVQVEGQRRWQLESTPRTTVTLIEGADLAVLSDFDPACEHVLGPGDVLYVPPGLAHHGVAVDDAQTWSIGLRAPNTHDLVLSYVDTVLEHIPFDAFYRTTDRRTPANQAEISSQNVQAFRALIDRALDSDRFASWLGRHLSRPRSEYESDDGATRSRTAKTVALRGGVRSAYVYGCDGGLTLFVNGDEIEVPAPAAPLARSLANGHRVSIAALDPATRGLIDALDQRGMLD